MTTEPAWKATMPDRIRRRPIDHRGFPVPWFVTHKDKDGLWDFRVADSAIMVRAVKEKRCWVCGETLGRSLAFLVGPMCVINRISSEPPMHRECATFAAEACPFLTKPRMRRNEKNLPEEYDSPGGIMIKRNPGVVALYMSRSFELVKPPNGGVLFGIGSPLEVLWFAEGREATGEEVAASIEGGLPLLLDIAKQDGPKAILALGEDLRRALPLLPKGTEVHHADPS